MAANGLDHYLGAFASDAAANAWLVAAGYTTYDGLAYRDTSLVAAGQQQSTFDVNSDY